MSPGIDVLLAPYVAGAGALWALHGVMMWRGVWRRLAAVPFAAFALWSAIYIVLAWMDDSSSHHHEHVWLIDAGLWFWPTLPYMALIACVRPRRIPRIGQDPNSDLDADQDGPSQESM